MTEKELAGVGPGVKPKNSPPRVLALCSSPRRNGNSRRLAEALLEGAAEAGSQTDLIQISDQVKEMLRDCRECRKKDGSCSIEDGFRDLFFEKALPADAWIYATPLWWYGLSAHLKNFLDRIFCYITDSYADNETVIEQLVGKRVAVVMSAEENNLPARAAVLTEVQELCRYLHHPFVGFVTGIGNSRGDVNADPSDSLDAARTLGRRLFEINETNYQLDTIRAKKVWDVAEPFYPVIWR
ncbi:MAG: flavodoxin family protein [Alphaproteobacteria bacterium]